MQKTSFTYKLDKAQQATLGAILKSGNYRPVSVPHTIIAVDAGDCRVNLYKSGKCLIQGKKAEDFILFILEPNVLQTAGLGYDTILNPQASQPHMGIDESGKGDFFGPMVIVSAYVDEQLVEDMNKLGVKDSKSITSDNKALDMGRELRRMLGKRFCTIRIGPAAYNRLYTKMRNVNTMLSWAHARAIEDLLESVPDCPMAISDQFGNKKQLEQAPMKKGRSINLIQRHKAESDLAVAAASVIARECFLRSLKDLEQKYQVKIPKGASAAVRAAAVELTKKHGTAALVETVKCHFRTTDQVLAEIDETRSVLGPSGQAVSKPRKPR